jgi:hypothetical protein
MEELGERRSVPPSALPDVETMPTAVEALPAEFAAGYAIDRPAWYFQTEGIMFRREESSDRVFAALIERELTGDAGASAFADHVTDVLGVGDLRFGFHAGGRVMIGRTLGAWHALEVSYFQLADWDELAAVRDDTEFIAEVDADGVPTVTYPASLFSPFSDFGNPPTIGLDYNDVAYVSYGSRLYNLEWNLRQWTYLNPRQLQVSMLVGGRYMNLDETLRYHTESAVPTPGGATNDVTTDTGNSMIGLQIGAMMKWHVGRRLWVDCEVKGAAFDNDASQNTVFVHDGVAAFQDPHVTRRSDHVAAFALDLNLTATLLVTPRLAVRGGYQALWIDGLALAPNNFNADPNALISGPAVLVSDGTAVYHGPHLGVTWIW